MNEMARITADQEDFRARFTTAEFERMLKSGAFDDIKIELVDGELERMQSPMSVHAMRQAKVVGLLTRIIEPGRLLGAVGLDLDNDTVLECDVAITIQPVDTNRRLRAADMLLVIEIAESTRSRDLGMKRRKYADAGIRHYWVVDGQKGVTHAFHLDGGTYHDGNPIPFGEPLPVPGTDATIVID